MTLKAKMTILALLFSPFPLLAVIYGNNDQSAIDQLSPLERRMSEPVAAMIDAETMENLEEHLPLADKIWQVFAIPGGNANGARRLCSDVKFLDELAIGTCSGVLIAPDLLATASHCVLGDSDQDFLNRFRWVFRYHQGEAIDPHNVYRAIAIEKKLIQHVKIFESPELMATNEERKKLGLAPLPPDQMDFTPYRDITVVRLDRSVQHIQPAIIDFSAQAIGTQLTTIGHPMGLPKKITRNGLVMGKIGDHYLTTTLDAVKGNSGGPVFNADTGALIGLIVNQGIQHAFSMDRKERCYRLTQYPENQTEAKNMSGVMNISLIDDVLERN